MARLFGKEAKRAATKDIREEINRKLLAGETPTIYWNGEKYNYSSPEHYALIKVLYRTKKDFRVEKCKGKEV